MRAMHLSPLGVRVYTHTRSLHVARVYVTRYAQAGVSVHVGAARTRVSPRRRTSSCTQQSCIVIYDGYMYKVDYIQPLVTALPVQEETGVTAALEFLYDALPVKF